jgi:hypothetical protein
VQEWHQKVNRLIRSEGSSASRDAMRLWRDECLAELATVLERVVPTKGTEDE